METLTLREEFGSTCAVRFSGCGSAATTDCALTAGDVWVATATYGSATFRTGVFFRRSDSPWPVDWDYGYHKVLATRGFAIVGLSQVYPDRASSAILSYPGLKNEFSGNQAAVMVSAYSDVRRGNRIADWDSGVYKLECGLGEYVSGLSQSAGSPYVTHGVQCSSTSVPNGFRDNCEVRSAASLTDDRGTTASGDWDPSRNRAECSAGKVVVGVSIMHDAWGAEERGRPHAILCCGSSARSSVAYDFASRDAGFAEVTSWDGSYNKGRCAPGYGVTGLSQLPDNSASGAVLCSPSVGGEFGEGSSAVLTSNNFDQRRVSRNADWDWGFVKMECGANEYVSGVSQSSTAPKQLHALRCTTGNLTNQGMNGCETHIVSDGDDRGGSPTSGDWSAARNKSECSAGKVVVGVSLYTTDNAIVARRGQPHRIICCDR